MKKNAINVELSILDDVTKAKNGFEQSAKQARLMVAAATNNLNDTLRFLNTAAKISDEYLQKAKELGSPELIKQGQAIKAEFEGHISKWQKIYNDIKKIQI